MSVFAIADLHLSLGSDKPMDVFPGWEGYVKRLEENWRALVSLQDTVVVAGDISWGMTLEDSLEDFRFIHALPGKKLLIKGNHDYFWSTKSKMERFLTENGLDSIAILQNNSFVADGLRICGSRGWALDASTDEDIKVLNREAGRLRLSLQHVPSESYEETAVFLHYPPVFANETCPEILEVLREYSISRCYYGHVHGPASAYAVNGLAEGVYYQMISCDYLKFKPILVR